MNKNDVCKSIQGDVIVLNDTNSLYFPRKVFEPYNSYLYTFTGEKLAANKRNFDIAVIVVIETDLPVLEVTVPEGVIQQKVNQNDNIQVDITYNVNPDDVFFSLIFIYNYDIVATKSYRYMSFAFKIWDLFSAFSATDINLLLRVSLYDPQFFMPLQTSFKLAINLNPSGGNITITPPSGYSMSTNFAI